MPTPTRDGRLGGTKAETLWLSSLSCDHEVMSKVRNLLALALTSLGLAFVAAACGSSDDAVTQTGSSGDTSSSGGGNEQACLLHNCSSDDECGLCDSGRTHCLVAEHRCVACDAASGSGCPQGQECSSFGTCVPAGKSCSTDGKGNPTITCATSADCVACDPKHQVCDAATKKCVACTDKDASACATSEKCVADQCVPKCPKTCAVDNDCGECGTAKVPAHACNAHTCAQCSPTYACPKDFECTANGTCEKICGLPGDVKGTCDADSDCAGCGGGANHCYVPVNGGHGHCAPQANGCSDLGKGVVVLPDPWNQYTNTCSSDGDCAGQGIDLNVGKLLREATGFEQIKDANLFYGMNVCANITVSDISCGICVPCKVDSDCKPIDVDAIAGDALGPLGKVAAAVLLDQIFGANDHQIHMYCQSVASGYGVCAPCPGLVNDCSTGGGNGMGSGMCSHDKCMSGDALDPMCGSCESTVCNNDSYCCSTSWDSTCVNEVDQYCNNACSSPANCHDICTQGDVLAESCDPCVTDVCAQDAYCCQTKWDATCVNEVAQYCAPKSCP